MMIIFWFRWVWIDSITVYASTHKWINKSNEKYFYWCCDRTRSAFIHVNSTQSSPNFTCSIAFARVNGGSYWLLHTESVLYGSLRLRANCMLSLLRFQFSFRLDFSNLLLKTSQQRLLCCYSKPIHALRIAAKRISTKWVDSEKNWNRFFSLTHSPSPCVLVIAIAW